MITVAMFPMHEDAAVEMAASLVRPHARLLVMLGAPIRTIVPKPSLVRDLQAEGATIISGRKNVLTAMKGVDVALLASVPEQVESFERVVHGGVGRVPFAVRHGFNAFEELALHDVPGFMSPSAAACGRMRSLSRCQTFLSRKVVSPRSIRRGVVPGGSRDGFFSYVHNYSAWPEEKRKFESVAASFVSRNGSSVQNFGAGSPSGAIRDMSVMPWSRGTIHLKGGHACCNAVVRSLSVGTPVIMDPATRERCFFDSIGGITIRDSVEDIVAELRRLDEDDAYMDEAVASASKAAMAFRYDDAYGAALAAWLGGLA